MSSTPFHPVVESWFAEKFGAPTDAQRLGWPEIAAGRHALIAAPTGSGKTLAAFLASIDSLLRQAVDGTLEDRTQVVYVSPLKALSNDIRRNLEAPLAEIGAAALAAGHLALPIRAAVRTGDTPQGERAKMLRTPPHILVTTPESLYLLLTSEKSRALLGGVKTVIVDEIHALARDKRGSHLSLTLERLEALCEKPPTRVGLSATQRPIEEIARFLVGARRVGADGVPDCRIVDTGHRRRLDLEIETPAEIGAVCSNEQWAELDDRLVKLIESHRSTLVFVNTRRMAERVAHRLGEKLGQDAVASHHGSLSRQLRLDAEERLKAGKLKAIVATASLELGIDVGFIDLVCQLGSPRSIATFLQRVGRAGHRLGVVPKGRLFALTRDELLEAAAMLRAIKGGRLDAVEMPVCPLDILVQQLDAEVSARGEASEDELFELFKRAWPYRALERASFDKMVELASEGVAKGRKDGAYLHRDQVHGVLRPRKAARMAAIMSGGAIPETADYRVVTEDDGTFVGTVNEDFAIESMAGDVFRLGSTSWRIRYVRGGQVVVSDAQGAAATIPFWLGEAPGRTIELSGEVSDLRSALDAALDKGGIPAAVDALAAECGVFGLPAAQAAEYANAQKAAIGFLPTREKILFERFFDETGGMQLVVHSPYGSRVNRAWGLAMRKKFCRTFDFELQASADDDGIVLSIGVQHSFPLEQMFRMVPSKTAKDTLVQALLAAPMFQLRWRWNLGRSLVVPRVRGGKKVPPPLQRFRADDVLTAVFPQQTACFEHRPPDLEPPDHPLIHQTLHDCLTEAMDVERWTELLVRIEKGEVELVGKDTREPSPFSHEILNANPYAFLDDAPLEERRARAVSLRRTLAPEDAKDLAKLDPGAIAQVREEAWPLARDAEELHGALLQLGALPSDEGARAWRGFFERLAAEGRAGLWRRPGKPDLWAAAERWSVVEAACPGGTGAPLPARPDSLRKAVAETDAVAALVRGHLEVAGPVAAERLARDLGLGEGAVKTALAALEGEGFVLSGDFEEPGQWCERRLLARIHRLTLDGARKAVRAVPPETYWRFLSEYHHLIPGSRRDGRLGLHEAVGQLQGFEIAAAAWETDVLPGRVEKYAPEWLDTMSFSGELAWGRLRPPKKVDEGERAASALTRVAPIALAFRDDLAWMLPADRLAAPETFLRPEAAKVRDALKREGALFFDGIVEVAGLLPEQVKDSLSELAALGLVTSDGFSALRGLVLQRPAAKRRSSRWGSPRAGTRGRSGRWTLFPGRVSAAKAEDRPRLWAWQLLRRYGVVFRDLLTREAAAPSWFELVPALRRLEARGEIRGGRFVSGVAGEQYALPEAVEELRRPRENGDWLVVSASDPLNLRGILDAEARVPSLRGNRLLYRDGRCVASLQAGEIRCASELEELKPKLERALSLQLPSLRDGVIAELKSSALSGVRPNT